MYIYVFLDENKCPYYVGQTTNFLERRWQHECCIRNTKKYKSYVYNKARKLIRDGHPFIMEVLDTAESKEELSELEIFYIEKFRNLGMILCNLTEGGDLPPSRKGWKLSEETKRRISESKSGKNNPHYGKKFSKEHRENISNGKTGVMFSEEHKKNLSIARRKRKITTETRNKTSKTFTGKINIKTYRLTDPNGKEYITEKGLTQFCKEHHIPRSSISLVLNGTKENWKGWKIHDYS